MSFNLSTDESPHSVDLCLLPRRRLEPFMAACFQRYTPFSALRTCFGSLALGFFCLLLLLPPVTGTGTNNGTGTGTWLIDIDSFPPFSHATRIFCQQGWLSGSEQPQNPNDAPSCPDHVPRPRTIVDSAT